MFFILFWNVAYIIPGYVDKRVNAARAKRRNTLLVQSRKQPDIGTKLSYKRPAFILYTPDNPTCIVAEDSCTVKCTPLVF